MTQGYKIQEKAIIRREECDIAQRTLECWLSQAGKMTHEDPKVQTEYTVRLGQAQSWATAIINSNLNRKETHMAYHGVLQAKIGYALAVTTFTKPQLQKIQRTVDVAYGPKIGLNRNFPNSVVQGPTQYCGLTQPPLYTIQGSKQLKLLIGTIRNQDDTGALAQASLELEQQESGYITPILHADTSIEYRRWSPNTWNSSIKQFLSKMKGTVQIYDQWCPTAQRQNDKSRMLAFQYKYKKQTKKLAQLNRCRI